MSANNLTNSQDIFKSLVHTIDGIIWECEIDTFHFTYVSPQSRDILGYEPKEWYEEPDFWKDRIHPDDRHATIRFCKQEISKGKNHRFEYRMMAADGRVVWLRDIVTVIHEDGKPSLLRGLMVDITQHKATEDQKSSALVKLNKRVKEQTCLYRISSLNEQKISIDTLLGEAADLIPTGWQFSECVSASIEFGGRLYVSSGFRETPWMMSASTCMGKCDHLTVTVAYLEEKPPADEGPFQSEERNLIESVASQLALKIDQVFVRSELKEKHDLLDKTYQLASIGDWTYETLTGDLYWSPVTKEVHGVNHDYIPTIEKTIEFFKEGPDRETFRIAVTEALTDEKPFDLELSIISEMGDERWVRISAEPEYEEGICTRFYGITQNISERKAAEEKLKLSEQRFKALVQDSSDLLAIIDIEGNYIYVSPSSLNVLGVPAEEYIGNNAFSYIHEEDQDRTATELARLEFEKRIFISPFRFANAEGDWRWIETHLINLSEDPAVGGIVANSRDVTDQIEKEERLKQLSLVASKTTDVVVITDPDDQITWVNSAFEKLTGYSFNEAVGRRPGELLSGPETEAETLQRLEEAKEGRSSITEDILQYTKDSRTYWLDVTIDPVFNEEGDCTDFIAIGKNITRQKREEQRLKLLESVITHTEEAVIILETLPSDLPGRKIIYANEGFSKMTGYERKEVIGRTLSFLNGPETDQEARVRMRQSLAKFETISIELINYRKSGEAFWIFVSMIPVTDKNGNYTHWISIGRDITESKQQQQRIVDSLKEKETLLAEIHHRVKNNLAVVSGMMQLQAFEEENKQVTDRLFNSIFRIKTMANIHEQLYRSNSFSKIDFSENIHTLVMSIVQSVNPEKKIDVQFDNESVQLNINQAIPCSLIVNEVVTNILKHAFSDRNVGTVSICLREDPLTSLINLEIRDNGSGLPADFSLDGNGSLGLSLIRVLSQQLKAEYEYKSEIESTLFQLQFKKAEFKGVGNSYIDQESFL